MAHPRHAGELADLLRLFPGTVDVPPLRLRLEDLEPLVTFFLAKLGHRRHVVVLAGGAAAAPPVAVAGQRRAVAQAAGQVVQHRRSGTIEPADLPPEMPHRQPAAAQPAGVDGARRDRQQPARPRGNKSAAAALGMSRATIYRKIHEYGIVVPGDEARS